jgi:hypothetical protein
VRTGRHVATVGGQDGRQAVDAFLLSNGRVAILEAYGPEPRLRLVAEGQADSVCPLPDGSAILSELPGGVLAVGRLVPARWLAGETLFFSSDTAEPRGREPGLLPALRLRLWPAHRVAGTAARLFTSDAGELVRFDPESRERHVLLPSPSAKR